MILNNIIGKKWVDGFNATYSAEAYSICPILRKFCIKVEDSLTYTQMIEHNGNQDYLTEPFINYIVQRRNYDATSVEAYIVYNEKLCEQIGFTDNDYYASIAHEIGHVIFHFLENKEFYDEELKADYYAAKMGLRNELISTLRKLCNSNRYNEDRKLSLSERIRQLENPSIVYLSL